MIGKTELMKNAIGAILLLTKKNGKWRKVLLIMADLGVRLSV